MNQTVKAEVRDTLGLPRETLRDPLRVVEERRRLFEELKHPKPLKKAHNELPPVEIAYRDQARLKKAQLPGALMPLPRVEKIKIPHNTEEGFASTIAGTTQQHFGRRSRSTAVRDEKFKTFTNMGQEKKTVERMDSNRFVLPQAMSLFGGRGDEVMEEPLSRTEKIFYQALADYERDTDPQELYELLDIQRRKKVLVSEDLLPSISNGQGGALSRGTEN